eukprot:Hpha_TRINITY_DN12602_c0_g1::TRINITY_DN12602_c0_g1_i1::g.49672::m.49672
MGCGSSAAKATGDSVDLSDSRRLPSLPIPEKDADGFSALLTSGSTVNVHLTTSFSTRANFSTPQFRNSPTAESPKSSTRRSQSRQKSPKSSIGRSLESPSPKSPKSPKSPTRRSLNSPTPKSPKSPTRRPLNSPTPKSPKSPTPSSLESPTPASRRDKSPRSSMRNKEEVLKRSTPTRERVSFPQENTTPTRRDSREGHIFATPTREDAPDLFSFKPRGSVSSRSTKSTHTKRSGSSRASSISSVSSRSSRSSGVPHCRLQQMLGGQVEVVSPFQYDSNSAARDFPTLSRQQSGHRTGFDRKPRLTNKADPDNCRVDRKPKLRNSPGPSGGKFDLDGCRGGNRILEDSLQLPLPQNAKARTSDTT